MLSKHYLFFVIAGISDNGMPTNFPSTDVVILRHILIVFVHQLGDYCWTYVPISLSIYLLGFFQRGGALRFPPPVELTPQHPPPSFRLKYCVLLYVG